jgi:hypothetical protein
MNAESVRPSASLPICRRPSSVPPPLSFAQQRLWFLNQLEEASSVYNLVQAWHLTGPLDMTSLEKSITGVLARHQALRMSFVGEQGVPVETTASEVSFTLPVVYLKEWPLGERRMKARQLMIEEACRPFDLCHGPLVRAVLFRIDESEYDFVLVLHHIISDGWSFGVLGRELETFYNAISTGQTPALPVLPIQYQDYAYWQRQWIKGEVLQTQLEHWKQHLAGALPLLQLPTDQPRPAAQSFRGANRYLSLPKDLSEALNALSRQ